METTGRNLDCSAAQELILRSHAEGLGEAEALALHAHIGSCSACRSMRAGFAKAVSGLRVLGRTEFGPRARVRREVLAGLRRGRTGHRTSVIIRPTASRRMLRSGSVRTSVRRRRGVAWARLAVAAFTAAAAFMVAAWFFPGLRPGVGKPAVPGEQAYIGLIRGEGRAVLVRRGVAGPAAEMREVLPGDRFELGEGVQLAVFYRDSASAEDRTVVRVNQGTAVTVLGTSGRNAVVLDRGDIYVSVRPRPGSSFTVNPGSADQVAVTGTAFEVSRSDAGTAVRVDHGAVQLGVGTSAQAVAASFSCAVGADGRMGEPERLSSGEVAAWRINSPPLAESMKLSVEQDSALRLELRASDPERDFLSFRVTSPPSGGTLSGEPPELTYTAAPGFAGEDTFAFRASDGRAESEEASVRIAVRARPEPPVASIMAAPISGPAPLEVRLDGSGSRCAAPPATYAWTFGDGETSAGQAAVTHTYRRPGDYVVELTVTDARGRSASATTTVRVSFPPGAARPPSGDGGDRPSSAGESRTAAKPAPADDPGPGKPEKPGKPEDPPGQADKPDKPGKPEEPGKPSHEAKRDQPAKRPKSTPPKPKSSSVPDRKD